MDDSQGGKILTTETKTMFQRENIGDLALGVGIVLFLAGVFLPLLMIPGSIIIASGIIAIALKANK